MVSWRAFVTVAAGALLGGCHCRLLPPTGAWHFEDDCVDATCGFRATQGTIARANTFATGEHGLAIGARSIATRTAFAPLRGPGLSFIGRCDTEGEVVLRLVLRTPTGDRPVNTTFSVTRDWKDFSGSIGSTTGSDGIRRIEIENRSGGECRLDAIAVGVPASMCSATS
ncbi:MAG: hypothetical protein JNK05_38630 [Myxococcales bacterium]|nr:hypothetical protein [Myxococcales bacterium]